MYESSHQLLIIEKGTKACALIVQKASMQRKRARNMQTPKVVMLVCSWRIRRLGSNEVRLGGIYN